MVTKKDVLKMLEAFEDDAIVEVNHTINVTPAPKPVNEDSVPTEVVDAVEEKAVADEIGD